MEIGTCISLHVRPPTSKVNYLFGERVSSRHLRIKHYQKIIDYKPNHLPKIRTFDTRPSWIPPLMIICPVATRYSIQHAQISCLLHYCKRTWQYVDQPRWELHTCRSLYLGHWFAPNNLSIRGVGPAFVQDTSRLQCCPDILGDVSPKFPSSLKGENDLGKPWILVCVSLHRNLWYIFEYFCLPGLVSQTERIPWSFFGSIFHLLHDVCQHSRS